jgi:signal transduction histidine kinase
MDKIPITFYAPAKRSPITVIKNLNEIFIKDQVLCEVLNAVPDIVLILNKERQIVFANRIVNSLLSEDNIKVILGMRPGELLNCEHSSETLGGCGTSEYCVTCGAVNSILKAQTGVADSQEYRITQKGGLEALDLKVFATPLSVEGNNFTIFSVIDISHEKRRRMLEKIFLHDIINTASSLRGASQLLSEAELSEISEYKELIVNLTDSLLEEIVAQREIAAAETNDLKMEVTSFDSFELLEEITRFYSLQIRGKGRLIKIDSTSEQIFIHSDRVLLRRVLGNMIKNALEATEPSEVITTGCFIKDGTANFWVHNDTFIPREYQLQIFQRSFSTKGSGRGIGTYSIKLLTEKYLKGKASLTSSVENGTVFTVACPMKLTI